MKYIHPHEMYTISVQAWMFNVASQHLFVLSFQRCQSTFAFMSRYFFTRHPLYMFLLFAKLMIMDVAAIIY